MCLEACISLLLSVPQGLEKAVLINMGGHTAPVQQLLDPPELFEQRELDLIYLYIVLLGADGRVHPRCRANGIPRRAERPAKIMQKRLKKAWPPARTCPVASDPLADPSCHKVWAPRTYRTLLTDSFRRKARFAAALSPR